MESAARLRLRAGFLAPPLCCWRLKAFERVGLGLTLYRMGDCETFGTIAAGIRSGVNWDSVFGLRLFGFGSVWQSFLDTDGHSDVAGGLIASASEGKFTVNWWCTNDVYDLVVSVQIELVPK